MIKLEPLFGVTPHTPGLCGEPDANPSPKRRRRRRSEATAPCRTCDGKIPEGSHFVCGTCHADAPDAVVVVNGHALPAAKHNRMEPQEKAEPATWVSPWLTKREAEALMADARRGEQPIEAVRQFLRGLDGPASAVA